jgi:hypothetical protein
MGQFQWLISAEGKSRETFDITVYTKYLFLKFCLGEGVRSCSAVPSRLGCALDYGL